MAVPFGCGVGLSVLPKWASRPSKNADTPSRRSSVPIESAIPWRSTCRCSVSELSRLWPISSFAIRT